MELSNPTIEQFCQLPNNRGQISNFGNYKNLKGKQLKGTVRYGYAFVYTGKKQERIHRLVAEMFLLKDASREEVNHIDGNKLNNHVSNLEWCTHLENMQHAFSSKLIKRESGEKSSRSILTQEQVNEIRKNYKPRDKKFGLRPLGSIYGVTSHCIWRIIANKNWN